MLLFIFSYKSQQSTSSTAHGSMPGKGGRKKGEKKRTFTTEFEAIVPIPDDVDMGDITTHDIRMSQSPIRDTE